MRDPNRNHLWARVLVDELARAGVREMVVAPGSRSAPLVLAAAANPRFRLVVQVDERSAGFLALGIGKATGRPGAVITTSGTAAANLLPAVVEAAQSETPLLVLSADRPTHLRGADANQAIDQVHLFGRYVRLFQELAPGVISDRTLRHLRAVGSRAVAAAVGDPAGPVHLNLPFDKPLEPTPVPGDMRPGLEEEAPLALEGRREGAPFTRIHPRRAAPPREVVAGLADRIRKSRRPLLVVGPVSRPSEVGPAVRGFSRGRGMPVLADPLSGARFGAAPDDGVVGGYDLFLGSSGFRSEVLPDLILRVGATSVSPALAALLDECSGVPQVVVDGGDRWKDHPATAGEYVPCDPAVLFRELGDEAAGASPGPEEGWLERWRGAEEIVRKILAREAEVGAFFEGAILSEVARWCPERWPLFVSSSMPVRDLDSFALGRDEPLSVFGNRGASGIDGIVSTACGVALATGRRVVAVLGDLALIHDMNGLLALREEGVRMTLVVIQNDGGGIFHLLPIRDHEPEFTRYFATPHGLEVARVAALDDLDPLRVAGRDRAVGPEAGLPGLRAALGRATDEGRSVLVEVRTDRNENQRRHGEIRSLVRQALES
jgi:2-succinyl-5-enolpyruvyl-6-hydroxy-3-cyclohexene-1-carboxylate synthase